MKHAKRIILILFSLSLSLVAADSPARESARVRVVNVNTATVAQLALLPGVGPKTAAAIVAARPYASADDLLRVKGIGPKRLAAMRAYVVLSGETTAKAKIHAPRAAKKIQRTK